LRWLGLCGHAATELWDDEAIHALAHSRVELARAAGALATLPNALAQLGGYEVLVGRFDAAEGWFQESREIAAATGNPGLLGRVDPGRLILSVWRGSEAEARTLAEVSTRDATARGQGIFVSFAQHALAILDIGLGHYREALTAAQEASEDNPFCVTTAILPDIVEAAVRCGERDVAAAAVERLADTAIPSGTEWGLGMLARSRALLAEGEAAEQLYEEAIDHLKRCRVTPQLARARLIYGEWLRRERRRRDARKQLRMAHEIFASMGAAAFADRAGVELYATGERTHRRTVEAVDLLTPHEVHIARLAAEGASNLQIAAQLFISPRTVEYHLSKVFRKLGIGSRTQLSRRLLERGMSGEQPESPGTGASGR
jgi:DNA-binding CsgD family transcriptional regulator